MLLLLLVWVPHLEDYCSKMCHWISHLGFRHDRVGTTSPELHSPQHLPMACVRQVIFEVTKLVQGLAIYSVLCLGTTTIVWARILAWSAKELAKFYLRQQFWLVLWFSLLIFINFLLVYQPTFLPFLCSSLYLRGLNPGNDISHFPLPPEFWIYFRLCRWDAYI